MQFGRFHGLASVVFGFFLLGCQVWLYLAPQQIAPSSYTVQASQLQDSENVNYLPGIVGFVALVTGGILFFFSRKNVTPPDTVKGTEFSGS